MDIRDERPDDAGAVSHVNRLAFGRDDEGRIVHTLREHGAVALSLVALDEGAVGLSAVPRLP